MYKQITDNIFSIYVELPRGPLKNTNAYLIKGKDRNLLIDTGYRTKICMDSLTAGLRELDVDMGDTDIFLTHFHPDHIGLVPDIVSPGAKVFMSAEDTWRQRFTSDQATANTLTYETQRANGFSDKQIALSPQMKSRSLGPGDFDDFTTFEEGAVFEYGGHTLKAVAVPGHTPGHMVLYDEANKLMFLGDHVLFDITPNIQRWMRVKDALGDYVQSLLKIRDYDVEIALPGHRGRKGKLSERVDALIDHHGARVGEAVDTVEKYPGQTAYQLASHMSWNIRYNGDWENFPMQQRVFAVGETRAHLEYLMHRDRVIREERDGVHYYHPGK